MTFGKLRIVQLAAVLVLTLTLSVVVVCLALLLDDSHSTQPDDQALLQLGATVYEQNCAACHGQDLEGEPDWQSGNPDGSLKAPPHDASGHTWHHSDVLLFRITKFGTAKAVGIENFVSNMPAFEDILSDKEIYAVLSWIKSHWPAEIRERHDAMNERLEDSRLDTDMGRKTADEARQDD